MLNTFRVLGELKLYFVGAGPYISLLNFIMLLSTFKQTFDIDVSVYYIIPIGVMFVFLIGYLDYTLILRHQVEHANKMNDIKAQLDRLEKGLYNVKH